MSIRVENNLLSSYDPFQVEEYNHVGVFGGRVYNTWIYGISSFYRVGDLALNIKNNSAIVSKF